MGAMIQAEGLTKVYRIGKVDVPALAGVSLSVEPGEFVSIVGPSGSGKSTLFYILGGLTGPTSGRVMIEGTDFSRLSDAERTRLRRRRIGFVFQKFNLLPTLDAAGNGADALEIFLRGSVDLVLSDLMMPGLDGAGLIAKIKEVAPSTPAILFSGKIKIYERETQADIFLPKGMYAPAELLERIRLLLVKKRGPKKAIVPVAALSARVAGQITAAS